MKEQAYVPITKEIKQSFGLSELNDLFDPSTDELKIQYRTPLSHAFRDWLDRPEPIPAKRHGELRPVLVSHGDEDRRLSSRALLVGESFALVQLDRSDSFASFVKTVTGLEVPIDRQLVILIPESWLDDSSINAVHRQIGLSWALGKREVVGPVKDLSMSQITECLVGLDLASRFPDSVDLVSRNSDSTRILRYLLQLSPPVSQSVLESHDRLSFFPRLLRLPLPDIELPVKDMIHVRDDGLFDDWRMAFSRTLTQLRDPGTLLASGDSEDVRALRAELDSASRQLGSRIERWKSLRRAVVGATGLSVACAAGALQAGAGPAESSAIGGMSYLAGMLAEYFGGRPTEGVRAFRRLVVQLFDHGEE